MEFLSCLSSLPVYCLIPVRIFVPRRQSVFPSSRMQEKTSVVFVSDLCHCFQWLLDHDWNYMSLLWNFCPCAFHWKHSPTSLSALAFFPFLTLGDWSSFHNIALDPAVSNSHHQINMKFYSCLQLLIVRLLASRRFLVIQSQHSPKLNRISPILICMILPGSIWAQIMYTPGRVFSSTLLFNTYSFPEMWLRVEKLFSRLTQSSHQSYRSQENLSRQLIMQSQLLWSRASWSEDLLF